MPAPLLPSPWLAYRAMAKDGRRGLACGRCAALAHLARSAPRVTLYARAGASRGIFRVSRLAGRISFAARTRRPRRAAQTLIRPPLSRGRHVTITLEAFAAWRLQHQTAALAHASWRHASSKLRCCARNRVAAGGQNNGSQVGVRQQGQEAGWQAGGGSEWAYRGHRQASRGRGRGIARKQQHGVAGGRQTKQALSHVSWRVSIGR